MLMIGNWPKGFPLRSKMIDDLLFTIGVEIAPAFAGLITLTNRLALKF